MSKKIILLFLIIILFFSCTQVIIDGAGMDKVASISPTTGYEDYAEYMVTKSFSTRTRVWYALWGLIPIVKPDIGQIVKNQSAGGDGVINLKIVDEYNIVDFLVDLFLGSSFTITTRSVKIEGDVIKIKKEEK